MKLTKGEERTLTIVVKLFKRNGILLESDPKLPSIAGLVIGSRAKGSWWGHPKGMTVWRVLNEFLERRDVLATKLVSGKVTFVHRRLWPQVIAVGVSKEQWQTASLSSDALELLDSVERKGAVRTDVRRPTMSGKALADAARELEKTLLVQSEQVHAASGKHAKVLRSWKRWRQESGDSRDLPDVRAAKKDLEVRLATLNKSFGANGRLPWNDARSRDRVLSTRRAARSGPGRPSVRISPSP